MSSYNSKYVYIMAYTDYVHNDMLQVLSHVYTRVRRRMICCSTGLTVEDTSGYNRFFGGTFPDEELNKRSRRLHGQDDILCSKKHRTAVEEALEWACVLKLEAPYAHP